MKVSTSQSRLAITIAGIVGASLTLLFIVDMSQVRATQHIDSLTHQDQRLPVRLSIPKINIDAAIEYVGKESDGSMGAPQDPANVAWFENGVRPGENGTAVIDGHFGWKDDMPAVFDHLSELRKGDKLSVIDGKGIISTFIVRELRIYKGSEDASEVFLSTGGEAHLNLITCEGVWDADSKSYSNRLVVFADKK